MAVNQFLVFPLDSCSISRRMSAEDTNSLIEQRKTKLASLRSKGIDPFQNKFTPSETCAAARANYVEGREVALAGRITDRKSTRLNSSHTVLSRMPSSA